MVQNKGIKEHSAATFTTHSFAYSAGLEEGRRIISQDDRQSPNTKAPDVCWLRGLEYRRHNTTKFSKNTHTYLSKTNSRNSPQFHDKYENVQVQ